MTLKELRDKLDRLCPWYGDADVFITAPDGGEPLVPEDLWVLHAGTESWAVVIGTESDD